MVLLTACSSISGTNEGGYITLDGNITQYAEGHRDGPVALSGQTLQGEDLRVEPGQVSVVNVWWSLCGPCRTEMPMLQEVAAENPDIRFVGINIRDSSPDNAIAFENEMGVDYPSLFDPDGRVVASMPIRVIAPPTTYVLDSDSNVSSMVAGTIPSKLTLEGLIEDAGGVLADSGTTGSAS
ncbi:MAG: TlpA family protein disulfide reductase [Nocardioides sp.]